MADGNLTEAHVFLTHCLLKAVNCSAKSQVQDSVSQQQESATSQTACVGKHCAQLQGTCSFAGARLKVLAGN